MPEVAKELTYYCNISRFFSVLLVFFVRCSTASIEVAKKKTNSLLMPSVEKSV